jgi:hypothetical protein
MPYDPCDANESITNEYDTNNPHSHYIVEFIRENKQQYNQEIHKCCNVCICVLSTVVVSIVIGTTVSMYFLSHKNV